MANVKGLPSFETRSFGNRESAFAKATADKSAMVPKFLASLTVKRETVSQLADKWLSNLQSACN